MSSTAPVLRTRVPRLAGAALERARLTVVPKRRTRRTSPVPFLVVVSMLAVGGIVGLLLFNTSMQQASFAATQMQAQADVLEAQQQSLQMQLDHLRDPQVIATKAQRMGMVLPTSPAVLDLRTGKVTGHPTPASGLNRVRLLGPAPTKPAEYDVTRGTTQGSAGNAARGAHDQTSRTGRNDKHQAGHRSGHQTQTRTH